MLQAAAELLWPTRCAGCDLPGTLLCDACVKRLPLIDGRWACRSCGAPFGWLACTECWQSQHAFEGGLSVGTFAVPLSRAVVLHKDAGERRLAAVLGGMVAERVSASWPGWTEAVSFIPASRRALARRGFDHGRAIAVEVARGLEVPIVDALHVGHARDQRSLGRVARAQNVADVFAVAQSVSGRILLVDDVMTTGATADAGAEALLRAGAAAVRVATAARAW